jgi:transcriptional regulator with XRE-family HTH domain
MGMMGRMKLIRGGKSQDTFAHDVGVSKMTVGRWERGERTPDADDLNRILKAYPDINPTWLLTGEGEMRRGNIVFNPLTGEEVYIEPGFHDELQVAVTRAIIELAAPGLDEQTVKNFASLYPETINALKEGDEIVPPIDDIKRIVRLFGALYDFYDSDNYDIELSGKATGSVTKRVEQIVSKGKIRSEKEFNALINELKTEFT